MLQTTFSCIRSRKHPFQNDVEQHFPFVFVCVCVCVCVCVFPPHPSPLYNLRNMTLFFYIRIDSCTEFIKVETLLHASFGIVDDMLTNSCREPVYSSILNLDSTSRKKAFMLSLTWYDNNHRYAGNLNLSATHMTDNRFSWSSDIILFWMMN